MDAVSKTDPDTTHQDTQEATGATESGVDRKPGSEGFFGGMSPQEVSRKGVEARRKKAQERAESAESNALTFRQRLGVSLSKLSQRELDERVKAAKPQELVRFADQAFGKPAEAEPDAPLDPLMASLTREQRAVVREMVLAGDESAAQDAIGGEREADSVPPGDPPPP